ncbi:MAG: Hpt domain-containing protein [Bacteroidota bacterium]
MNLSTLINYSSGDKDFVRSTVKLFIAESEKTLNQLHDACRGRDWEKVNRLAHSLKSNYATFDMEDLRKMALTIEQKAKNYSGDGRDLMKMIDPLDRKTRSIYPSLRRELDRL